MNSLCTGITERAVYKLTELFFLNKSTQGLSQGLYPFPETNFQDFSRTQIDFSRVLKFTLTPTLPRSQCQFSLLPSIHFIFLVEFNRFPELSRTSGLFPGLSSPGKCHNKITGLSRFSRTHTNPVISPAFTQTIRTLSKHF